MVMGVAAALMALAVAIPPRTSNDVWAYAMYGRIVTEYHASPYVHAPEGYPSDPYFAPAKRGFHDVKSVYGPAFTGLSAGVMEVAGSHTNVARILFQGLAGLSVLGALALLWRKTKDPGVLVFAGMNPVVAASVVNGGHNDAMVGLAILGGAYAAPAHPIMAGVILGLAASIKIVALLPLAAVGVWTFYRRGLRSATQLIASGLLVLAAGYVAVGGFSALSPLSRGQRLVTQHSIWFELRLWISDRINGSLTHVVSRSGHIVGLLGLALVVVLAAVLVTARHRKASAEDLAGTSLAPYLLGASYVLPWYPAWVLPSLARERMSLLARIVALQAILLFAVDPQRIVGSHGFARAFSRFGLPVFEAAAMIALVLVELRASSAGRETITEERR
jgi:hypothetical protein